MTTPKFRLFAGPNASGKTYLFNKFRKQGILHTEIYVNADRIETELIKHRKFIFNSYRVKADEKEFKDHVRRSGIFVEKINDASFLSLFSIRSGVLLFDPRVKINSYHASFVATYLAEKLFDSGQSFAFETVMSHASKLKFLSKAKSLRYKTYLYFVFTDDLNTNLARVQLRVRSGGHNVAPSNTLARAPRTFKLLPKAFELADSAYVIDNSDESKLVLKKENTILYRSDHFPEILRKTLNAMVRKNHGAHKKM